MIDLYLHGPLAERFGEHYALDVRDPAEAMRALCIQLPEFRQAVAAEDWHLVRGALDTGEALDEETLMLALGSTETLHLLPAAAGAGGDSGIGKAIAGVALIGASFFVPGAGALGYGIITKSAVAGLGVSMALTGVSMMLAPSPQVGNYGERETPAQRPSFLFDGPVNTSTQGLPVPLVYGRVRAGSVVVSAGMNAEEI